MKQVCDNTVSLRVQGSATLEPNPDGNCGKRSVNITYISKKSAPLLVALSFVADRVKIANSGISVGIRTLPGKATSIHWTKMPLYSYLYYAFTLEWICQKQLHKSKNNCTSLPYVRLEILGI